jgi:hypothetical protein
MIVNAMTEAVNPVEFPWKRERRMLAVIVVHNMINGGGNLLK